MFSRSKKAESKAEVKTENGEAANAETTKPDSAAAETPAVDAKSSTAAETDGDLPESQISQRLDVETQIAGNIFKKG
jgi:hypothetical protein